MNGVIAIPFFCCIRNKSIRSCMVHAFLEEGEERGKKSIRGARCQAAWIHGIASDHLQNHCVYIQQQSWVGIPPARHFSWRRLGVVCTDRRKNRQRSWWNCLRSSTDYRSSVWCKHWDRAPYKATRGGLQSSTSTLVVCRCCTGWVLLPKYLTGCWWRRRVGDVTVHKNAGLSAHRRWQMM